MVLLAALALFPQQPATLTLAADTYLDRRAPDANAGREPFLIGGVDKFVLVRFPDLGVKIGAGKKVRSAKMILTLAKPGIPQGVTVSQLVRPWGEGGDTAAKAEAAPGGANWGSAMRGSLQWERDGASGANDAQLVSGTQGLFANDALTISGLESAVQAMVDNPQENYGFRLAFASSCTFFSADSLALGPQLVVEFDAEPDRPGVDLQVLLCEPKRIAAAVLPPHLNLVNWIVSVRNAGEEASATQSLLLTVPGRDTVRLALQGEIPAGETRQYTFEAPPGAISPVPESPTGSFVVRVEPGTADKNPSDNGIVVYPHGLEVSVTGVGLYEAQQAITELNERVFPFSKFGAWPTGCVERLRLVSQGGVRASVTEERGLLRSIIQAVAALPDALVRPYAGDPPMAGGVRAAGYVGDLGQVGLLPDTRDDILIPRDLAIPARSSTTSFADVPMNEWGMLSRSEVTVINSQVGKPRALPWEMTPTAVFFRVFTPEGRVPPGSRLDVYQLVGGSFGSQPVFTSDLTDGSALMTRPGGSFGKSNPFGDLQKDGSNGWLLAVVRAGGSTSSTWIPVMQLWDEFARGNQAAAFIELRVQPTAGPLDLTQNLALGGLVTDARGRFPAELNALVDGKNETGLALADEGDGYWIDIDLGRDRQLGQIQLVFDGPVWRQFRIVTYKTAQSPSDAQMWSEESNGPANSEATKTEDGKTVLPYSSRSVRSRFVRIVPLSREAVKLVEVRVIPIQT